MVHGAHVKNWERLFCFLRPSSYSNAEAQETRLWLGQRGPLQKRGIYDAILRRAAQAGLDPQRAHPQALRKIFCSRWIEKGGGREELQNNDLLWAFSQQVVAFRW